MSLTNEEIAKLRKLLESWSEKSPEDNPRFNHDKPRVAAVRLSAEMYEDGLRLARSKGNWRTFSRMLEMLLWEAFNRDPKYIKESPDKGKQELLDLEKED